MSETWKNHFKYDFIEKIKLAERSRVHDSLGEKSSRGQPHRIPLIKYDCFFRYSFFSISRYVWLSESILYTQTSRRRKFVLVPNNCIYFFLKKEAI